MVHFQCGGRIRKKWHSGSTRLASFLTVVAETGKARQWNEEMKVKMNAHAKHECYSTIKQSREQRWKLTLNKTRRGWYVPWGCCSVAEGGLFVGFRQDLARLADPGADGVGVAAPLLGEVHRRDHVLYALVNNLRLLLRGQHLSRLARVVRSPKFKQKLGTRYNEPNKMKTPRMGHAKLNYGGK